MVTKTMNSMPRGFTLLELMVALTVIAIVAAIAVPSMQDMIQNSKAERITGLFELDLQFARSHAISRGEVVRISARDGDIVNGWQIIAETSGDTLRQRGGLDDGVSITSRNDLDSVAFTAMGQIENVDTIAIRIQGCTGIENRDFSLLSSGQIAVTEVACAN
ncbi:GspH/FimT family pseudopilin [Thalassolituus maritimus]|jgi:prepilin-type N-terminal cleavage/methylation domain-containing protein|uniref:Type II secretion system protein H n=1 Tax=Thalassolituus maritimus TaxID=484498 RepID=A0ABP9ZW25_9GAMM